MRSAHIRLYIFPKPIFVSHLFRDFFKTKNINTYRSYHKPMPRIFQKSATSAFLQSRKKTNSNLDEYDEEFLLIAG
jgi:hypothetical protein